jgi:hypothetical protein
LYGRPRSTADDCTVDHGRPRLVHQFAMGPKKAVLHKIQIRTRSLAPLAPSFSNFEILCHTQLCGAMISELPHLTPMRLTADDSPRSILKTSRSSSCSSSPTRKRVRFEVCTKLCQISLHHMGRSDGLVLYFPMQTAAIVALV